jgi:hypothetical protein
MRQALARWRHIIFPAARRSRLLGCGSCSPEWLSGKNPYAGNLMTDCDNKSAFYLMIVNTA